MSDNQQAIDLCYFDDAYFNDGQSKGTHYCNYIVEARRSLVNDEIARAIIEIFKPRRSLEIGCATGIIVKKLNDFGIDAHGIDISQWAVDNKEHPNVVRAGADELPYENGTFDLIYSVHALEHIPHELKDAAFREMRRVSSSGLHWHLLPIIKTGLSANERASAVQGLRVDPTHNLLEEKSWWINEFATMGINDTHSAIYIGNEPYDDFSDSQLLLYVENAPSADVLDRLREWNFRLMRASLWEPRALTFEAAGFTAENGTTLVYEEAAWKEAFFASEAPGIDLTNGQISLVIISDSDNVILRIAIGSGPVEDPWAHSLTQAYTVLEGLFCLRLRPSHMRPERGSIDLQAVRRISVGGHNSHATTSLWLMLPNGSRVPLSVM